MQNGGLVLSKTVFTGNGGPINVTADSIVLDGSGTGFSSQTTGVGTVSANGVSSLIGIGGNISLTGGTLSVRNNASIAATTTGSGTGGSIGIATTGDVAVNAGSQILSSSDVTGASSPVTATGVGQSGDAGAVTINAGTLTLSRGGSIRSLTLASGNAGKIVLKVEDAFTINGADGRDFLTGVDSEAARGSSSSAGVTQVKVGSVSVFQGVTFSNTQGSGAGGSVEVATSGGALLLDGGGVSGTEIGASALGT